MKLFKFFILTLILAATTATISLDASKKRKNLKSDKDPAQSGTSSKVRKVDPQEKICHLCSKPINDEDGTAEKSCCEKTVHNKCIGKTCATCELRKYGAMKRKGEEKEQPDNRGKKLIKRAKTGSSNNDKKQVLTITLPEELWTQIFSFFPGIKAIATFPLVSKPFNQMMQNPLTISSFNFSDYFINGKNAGECPFYARKKQLSIQKITDKIIFYNKIQKLTLSGKAIIDDVLKIIALYLKDLEELSLSRTSITNDGLKELAPLTSLKRLDISHCQAITHVGLRHLASLTQLQDLNLKLTNIADDGLKELALLTSLKSLNLSWCRTITHVGLTHLASLTQLQDLNLSNTNITGDDLKLLESLTQLKNLDLGCSGISDDGLKSLHHFPTLRRLNLDGNDKITDNGLAILAQLPNTQYIEDLSLETNNLNPRKITDDGLKFLAHFFKLRRLSLKENKITDNGLAILAQLPNAQYIEDLNLSKTNISDDGLKELAHFPNLKYLDISSCEGLSCNIKGELPEKLLLSCPKLQRCTVSYLRQRDHTPKEYNQNQINALRDKLLKEQTSAQSSSHESLMKGGK